LVTRRTPRTRSTELRRWVVERLFAWLHWFRRLVVRYEFHAENFLGMVRLGCMKIVLRYL
jgi:transposase